MLLMSLEFVETVSKTVPREELSCRQLNVTCQAVEKGTGPLIPSDSRGQWHTCGNVSCPTGKTPEPAKEKKEPLAVNALEPKEDFQDVNWIENLCQKPQWHSEQNRVKVRHQSEENRGNRKSVVGRERTCGNSGLGLEAQRRGWEHHISWKEHLFWWKIKQDDVKCVVFAVTYSSLWASSWRVWLPASQWFCDIC